MGILEGILLSSLLYLGGFFHGYTSKEDKVAKTINLQIPQNLKEEYLLPDCFDTKKKSCEQIIPRPRYFVSEQAYYNKTKHSRQKTLYLNISQDMTDAYNKDKYIED